MAYTSPESLAAYWGSQYPCDALVDMLTRNGDPLKRFEFAFECQSMVGDDQFMQRYQSFENAAQMREALRVRSKHSKILKLHIGACWSGVPRKAGKVNDPKTHDLDRLRPHRAPLRIDIDLTDYLQLGVDKDDVDANDLHWPILNLAIRVTERALRDCFGMDELVSFYSGRRGVHIWVLDERAWQMDDEARATVIEFLSCPLDKRGVAKEGFLARTPWYEELYAEEVLPTFVDMLVVSAMDLLGTSASICRFEDMMNITHPKIVQVFRELKMDTVAIPTTKFQRLIDAVEEMARSKAYGWMPNRLNAAVLTLMWPRFDRGASAKLNHLIKAPFSVHSSTGRIAVPLPDDRSNFWPGDVPKIGCEAHKIHSAEGVLRDKLAALGAPKPWTDPTEEWYMRWAPGVDSALQQVQRHEEEERRMKRRKLGVDDGISEVEYKASRNMWIFKIFRKLEYQLDSESLCINITTRFHDSGVPPAIVRPGKEFVWVSKPVKEVWDAFVKIKDTCTGDEWKEVTHDKMVILLPADDAFSTASKKAARQKLDAILERSQDAQFSGVVAVPRVGWCSHEFRRLAFPDVVRLWPVPGVVEL